MFSELREGLLVWQGDWSEEIWLDEIESCDFTVTPRIIYFAFAVVFKINAVFVFLGSFRKFLKIGIAGLSGRMTVQSGWAIFLIKSTFVVQIASPNPTIENVNTRAKASTSGFILPRLPFSLVGSPLYVGCEVKKTPKCGKRPNANASCEV